MTRPPLNIIEAAHSVSPRYSMNPPEFQNWWNLLGEIAWIWVRPGKCLRDERRRRGLTMGDVSDATGVPVYVISSAERGRREPPESVRRLFDYWI